MLMMFLCCISNVRQAFLTQVVLLKANIDNNCKFLLEICQERNRKKLNFPMQKLCNSAFVGVLYAFMQVGDFEMSRKVSKKFLLLDFPP